MKYADHEQENATAALEGLWQHIRKTHNLQVSPNQLLFALPL
jgi:hypothetical protein